MRLFIVNVGVNTTDAARRGTKSPVFPDGSFEFVPIKEPQRFAGCSAMPTYAQLRSWTGLAPNLAAFVPERVRAYRAHADPEFETFTYGDVVSPRAANLATVIRGDDVWFLARLWAHDGVRWTGASDFYFIGRFEVAANIAIPADSTADGIPAKIRDQISANAHFRRLQYGDHSACRVLVGQPEHSCRFARALRVTPEVIASIYGGRYDPEDKTFRRAGRVLTNRNGKPRRLSTFGSVTRAVQAFLSSEEPEDNEHLEFLTRLATACGRAR